MSMGWILTALMSQREFSDQLTSPQRQRFSGEPVPTTLTEGLLKSAKYIGKPADVQIHPSVHLGVQCELGISDGSSLRLAIW